ncbi:TIM-barrel domain-containing protein [Spiroplasma poulsonii]|uniref:Putative alpha-xylosidase n=2 Tax=Spiroplasma poulsonii TaxID=2138 RepID=A0A2P6FFG0_9MOLU|nr:TIM-barrel domain-containing protein [Spiroplasma poulsonii]KAF0850020.1 putative alpha-xylosidase [Spiroplasma poulsonii]PQM32197.1 putative alpha-xylosidase [Spiroplasma poulsonii]PWF94843.1 Alpha-xylosidase [Spiroplasma poulsonii]PWF97642.1 Alpha-xylosidase [Spiroplasma poulsonii]
MGMVSHPIPPNAYFNNGLTGEEFRQYYHFLYCKTAYDASVKYFGPNKTLSFCRPGYIGTQRFSEKWSGDSYSNFTELKIHLNAGLSLGVSGEMAWGTDIGGFYSRLLALLVKKLQIFVKKILIEKYNFN